MIYIIIIGYKQNVKPTSRQWFYTPVHGAISMYTCIRNIQLQSKPHWVTQGPGNLCPCLRSKKSLFEAIFLHVKVIEKCYRTYKLHWEHTHTGYKHLKKTNTWHLEWI